MNCEVCNTPLIEDDLVIGVVRGNRVRLLHLKCEMVIHMQPKLQPLLPAENPPAPLLWGGTP